MAPFVLRQRIRLARTDAGGVVYFAEFAALAHEAYEAFLEEVGYSVRMLLDKGTMSLPVVDVAMSLTSALRLGDDVDVEVRVGHLGTTSFQTTYRMRCGDREVATAKLAHVCLDRASHRACPIPVDLRGLLAPHLSPT